MNKCLNCGKNIENERNTLFCSNECYQDFRKNPNTIVTKDKYAEIIIKSIKYGNKIVLIDLDDVEKCKQYKWFLSFDEYLNSFYVKTSKFPYSLHRVITNCQKGYVVDHINHDTLDNRKSNLKVCTHSDNMKNRKKVKECSNCIYLKRQNEILQQENENLKTQIKTYAKVNEEDTKEWLKYRKCINEIYDLCKIAKNSNTGFYTLCDVVMLKINEVKNDENRARN